MSFSNINFYIIIVISIKPRKRGMWRTEIKENEKYKRI